MQGTSTLQIQVHPKLLYAYTPKTASGWLLCCSRPLSWKRRGGIEWALTLGKLLYLGFNDESSREGEGWSAVNVRVRALGPTYFSGEREERVGICALLSTGLGFQSEQCPPLHELSSFLGSAVAVLAAPRQVLVT